MKSRPRLHFFIQTIHIYCFFPSYKKKHSVTYSCLSTQYLRKYMGFSQVFSVCSIHFDFFFQFLLLICIIESDFDVFPRGESIVTFSMHFTEFSCTCIVPVNVGKLNF